MTVESSSPKTKKIRLAPESFSDVIFGLALSMGTLILIQSHVTSALDFTFSVVLFGFSFVIIALTWLLFSRTICYLSTDDSPVVFLSLALFFCVALEPYLFYLVTNSTYDSIAATTSLGYALDVGSMFVILAGLSSMVVKQNKFNEDAQFRKLEFDDLERMKHSIKIRLTVSVFFLVSALPFFWITSPLGHVRYLFWFASFAVFFISHGFSNLKKAKTSKTQSSKMVEAQSKTKS